MDAGEIIGLPRVVAFVKQCKGISGNQIEPTYFLSIPLPLPSMQIYFLVQRKPRRFSEMATIHALLHLSIEFYDSVTLVTGYSTNESFKASDLANAMSTGARTLGME